MADVCMYRSERESNMGITKSKPRQQGPARLKVMNIKDFQFIEDSAF